MVSTRDYALLAGDLVSLLHVKRQPYIHDSPYIFDTNMTLNTDLTMHIRLQASQISQTNSHLISQINFLRFLWIKMKNMNRI